MEADYANTRAKFEAVAKTLLNNNLVKYSAKDYFLKAGICHLAAGDPVATKCALEYYKELDNSFRQTKENMLLSDLVGCVKEDEQEAFADKLFQYDQLSKLDRWKTMMLLRVKNAIEKEEGYFSWYDIA